MPQPLEFQASCVAVLGLFEDLLRLHIEEPQPHGTMAHDSLHVPASAAAAEPLLLVERNHRMAALPHTRRKRVPAVADPNAQGPHPDHTVQLAMRGCQSCSHPIGIVHNCDRNWDSLVAQL